MLHKWEGVLLAGIIVAAFWIGMYGEQKGYFARTAYTLLAVLYIGKLLTYFVFIRQIDGNGMWLTFYVIAIIALTDIFAMVVGTLHRAAPAEQDLAEQNGRRLRRIAAARDGLRDGCDVVCASAPAMVAGRGARRGDERCRASRRPGRVRLQT